MAIAVVLLESTPNPERLIAVAARMCYSALPVENILDNLTDEACTKLIEKISISYFPVLYTCSKMFLLTVPNPVDTVGESAYTKIFFMLPP